MVTQRRFFLAVLVLLSLPVRASDVSGTWTAKVDAGDGPVDVFFRFNVDGEKLTGTTGSAYIPATPIENGTIKGNEISFKASLPILAVTIGYHGILDGDKLTITATVLSGGAPGSPREVTYVATRSP